MCNIMSFYRSPGQSIYDFEMFLENVELSFDRMAEKKPFHDGCSW